MQHSPRFFWSTIVLALTAGHLQAQTTTTIACSLDNTLYESATGSFSNALGDLFVGVTAQGKLRRALLRFDVAAALPADARVLSATLQLEITGSGAPTATTATVHRATRPWGEGTSLAITGGGGQGAPTTPGDATWLHAVSPTSPWTMAGGDFDAAPRGSIALPVLGTTSGTVDPQLVEAWLTGQLTNHGVLLKTAEQFPVDRARRLASRETPAIGPSLVVIWIARGATGAWGQGCALTSNVPQLAFTGAPLGGSTLGIVHTNAPPLSLGVDAFSLALVPTGVTLAGACTVFLADPLLIGGTFATDGVGSATTTLALPAGFPDVLVVAQSAILDGSPLGFALTGAGLLVMP